MVTVHELFTPLVTQLNVGEVVSCFVVIENSAEVFQTYSMLVWVFA